MEFDRIYAEVDLGRIEENMEAMKEHLRPGTKMYGVVKTDAYGHGAVPVARTIDRFVCGYAVATILLACVRSTSFCVAHGMMISTFSPHGLSPATNLQPNLSA